MTNEHKIICGKPCKDPIIGGCGLSICTAACHQPQLHRDPPAPNPKVYFSQNGNGGSIQMRAEEFRSLGQLLVNMKPGEDVEITPTMGKRVVLLHAATPEESAKLTSVAVMIEKKYPEKTV